MHACVYLKKKGDIVVAVLLQHWALGLISEKQLIDPGIQVIEIHAIHVQFHFGIVATTHIFSFVLHFPLELLLSYIESSKTKGNK